jgi:hypothetical protein
MPDQSWTNEMLIAEGDRASRIPDEGLTGLGAEESPSKESRPCRHLDRSYPSPMNPYDVCASCARYVKQAESTCPFCGALERVQSAPARGHSERMSRSAWLAYGGSALAFLGCTNGGIVSSSNPDASAGAAALGDAGFLCVRAGSQPFFDADIVCNRTSEWCYTNHGFEPTGCLSLATTCAPPVLADACSSVFDWDAAACDGGTPRCSCLTLTCSGWCADDDAGGITVSCGSCYGAPPARHERLLMS